MIEFFNAEKTWHIKNQNMYSDGTPMVKVGQIAYQDILNNATGVVIKTTRILELFTGLAFVEGVIQNGGDVRTLVLPYIPGARQDRVNQQGDVLATLSMVGYMIDACGFDEVITADAHSRQSNVAIENMVDYSLSRIYKRIGGAYDGVIAPDKGGVRRATIAAETLGLPLTCASKNRDVATGTLTGFGVDVEAGKHYLVVDDLCDGGGTFIGLGSKITEQGATADLYVTHGIFAKGTNVLSEHYGRIITTDSINRDFDARIEVIKIVDDMKKF